MTNHYDLSKRVIKTAWTDTCAFFGWNFRTLVVAALTVVGFVIYWQVQGWDAVKQEMLVTALIVLGPMGLFAFGLMGWNLFLAPFKIVYEASQQLAAPVGVAATPKKPPTLEKLPKKKGPDYVHWDLADRFRIEELSKLLGGQLTSERGFTDPAQAWYRTLDEAIKSGKLGVTKNDGYRYVSRQDLLTFFTANKTKHPLLHKEERKK